jgi:hypothetical protein
MGKAKRDKQLKEQVATGIYMDCIATAATFAVAKVLSEKELNFMFQVQHERLVKQGFSKEDIDHGLAQFAHSIKALKGDTNDKSRKAEELRPN